MDRQRLNSLLRSEGIDPDAYNLDGGQVDEAYVLDQRGSAWVVYFSERGLESGIEEFDSESLACHHLLELLMRDSTTGRNT